MSCTLPVHAPHGIREPNEINVLRRGANISVDELYKFRYVLSISVYPEYELGSILLKFYDCLFLVINDSDTSVTTLLVVSSCIGHHYTKRTAAIPQKYVFVHTVLKSMHGDSVIRLYLHCQMASAILHLCGARGPPAESPLAGKLVCFCRCAKYFTPI